MTVTAPSDGVVRIETERATHVMDAVLAEWVFTVYKKEGDEFVFTGPYAVDAFVGGERDHDPRRRGLGVHFGPGVASMAWRGKRHEI